jgi:hypothetical protein
MKSLIAMLVLSTVSLAYSANSKGSNWVITSPAQKRVLSQDTCASSALEAAASLVSEEIKEAGVDFPDHLYLSDLHVSSAGRYYSITFKSDSTILVQTRRYGMGCKVIQVGRIGIE